jgi:tetratricopeptide (TPR) repeat protein
MPLDAEAWALDGTASAMAGDYSRSERSYRKSIQIQPAVYSTHTNLGNVLKATGKPAEAETHYRSSLAIRQDNPQALNNLAVLLMEKGELTDAKALLSRAIELAPSMPQARNNLGNLCLAENDLPGAEVAYRAALETDPDYVDALLNLAGVQASLARFDEAERNFRRALALAPDRPAVAGGLARLLERVNRNGDAYDLIAPFIAAGTDNAEILTAFAALADWHGDPQRAIRLLETALPGQDSERHRSDLHFALGDLYDRQGDYAAAFRHYTAANRPGAAAFDIRKEQSLFGEVIRLFGRERFRACPDSGNRTRLPVFVVGMPRSGTTLVEQIVASHPLVAAAGEQDFIDRSLRERCAASGPDSSFSQVMEHLMNRETLDEMARQYLGLLRPFYRDEARVTDKNPHNFMHIGLIARMFPEAGIIHCTRDPRDTCLSIYFKQFSAEYSYASSLDSLAAYYRLYEALMAHWSQALSIRMLEVNYESLVEDQEGVTRTMLDFLGLPWDASCLRFNENRRAIATPSYQQVRKPIYRNSVGRWKNYAPFLGDFLQESGTG